MQQGRKPEFHVDTVRKKKIILEKLYKEQAVRRKEGAFYRQITRAALVLACKCSFRFSICYCLFNLFILAGTAICRKDNCQVGSFYDPGSNKLMKNTGKPLLPYREYRHS